MILRKCENCGASLDPGEVCDCTKTYDAEKKKPPQKERPQTQFNYNIRFAKNQFVLERKD